MKFFKIDESSLKNWKIAVTSQMIHIIFFAKKISDELQSIISSEVKSSDDAEKNSPMHYFSEIG